MQQKIMIKNYSRDQQQITEKMFLKPSKKKNLLLSFSYFCSNFAFFFSFFDFSEPINVIVKIFCFFFFVTNNQQ